MLERKACLDTIDRACHKAAGSIKDRNSQAFMETLVRIGAIGDLKAMGSSYPVVSSSHTLWRSSSRPLRQTADQASLGNRNPCHECSN